jgi:hypothetical protein
VVGNHEHPHVVDARTVARSVNEPEAFAELFERHFFLVYRFLSLRAGEQSAGDLAAETFAIAFRRRVDYDLARAEPENKKARCAGLFFVELAGLEPATSWVRFTREASSPFATARRLCQPSGFAAMQQRRPSPCFVVAT